MHLLVVRRAGLHARHSQVEGITAAVVVALGSRARCIQPFVRTVVMKRWYLSSHVATNLSIAATATSHKELAAPVTAVLAGSAYERDQS